jgi:uncharacterized protein (TIGR03437 family)
LLRYTGAASLSLFVGEAARFGLAGEGGTPPYRWVLASGALPSGIALAEDGTLSGTPLEAGTSNVTLRLSDMVGRTAEVPITLTVGAPRPAITPNGIVNGASFAAGSGVAPGEIITVFGVRMGPPQVQPFLLDSTGRVPTALAGTRLLVDGIPAPLLYVSATQIGAIVPYGIGSRATVEIVADANGVRSEPVTVARTAAAPGVFTLNASGRGQAAALNENGSLNGGGNPARRGSVLVLYATGEGQTLPAGQDGTIQGSNPARPSLEIRVVIGGREAQILYAGGAPGLVSGLLQVNARVPDDAPAGDAVPLTLRAGQASSPEGVTVSIGN